VSPRSHEWATVARHYIKWNEIEKSADDSVEKIRAFCDEHWADVAQRNIKVIPRVYLEWPRQGKYWPADLEAGDYESEQFKKRLVRMIEKMGEAWDNDPRVAYIESGIIGYWGEQHSPQPTPEIEKLMGDAFTKYFKHKLVMVRYPIYFKQYRFGVYWDSWGTKADTQEMTELLTTGPYADRWMVAPMGGEVSYNYGGPPGETPEETLTAHIDFAEGLVRRLHWNHLGWIANYNGSDPAVRAGADRLQKAFGYRFVIEEVRYPARVSPGGSMAISFGVSNTGSSPFYYQWPVEVSLLDPATRKPVWQATFDGLDTRKWLPGTQWNDEERRYDTPPAVNRVEGTFDLPADLSAGEYVLALAVLDPAGNLPAARFATTHYYKGGRHPIGRVGMDADITDARLDEAGFDDPATDDSLHYTPPR